jgi:hypothetical protein
MRRLPLVLLFFCLGLSSLPAQQSRVEITVINKTGAFFYITLNGLDAGAWTPMLNKRLIPPVFNRNFYHTFETTSDTLSRFAFLFNYALYPEEDAIFEVNSMDNGIIYSDQHKFTITFDDEHRLAIQIDTASLWEKFKNQL